MSLKGKASTDKVLRGRINRLDILTLSAYEIAVKHGFEGTEEEWLKSLEVNPDRIQEYVNEYLNKNPVATDATLSTTGMAADAKATGEAIAETRSEVYAHTNHKGNPHGVTAEQVGARPDDWMPTAEEVGARPDTWMPTAEEVGARPDDWMPTAEQVGAQEQHLHFVVNLPVSGWNNNKQTVACEGVTTNNTLIVASEPENYDAYSKAGVYCSAQAVDSLTFTCKSVPTTALNANVMILT